MTNKKIVQTLAFLLLLSISIPSGATAITGDPVTTSTTKTEDPRARQLMDRLDDIKKMDKSELTGAERKNLRKEVKGIRKEMKSMSGGVYLSVGAIIIVILILILIL